MPDDRISSILMIGTFAMSMVLSSMVITLWERGSAGGRLAEASALTPFADAGSLPAIPVPGIDAEAYLVQTVSGRVITSHNADVIHPMASLTKVMTGLLLKEWGSNADIWVTPRAKEVAPKLSTVPPGEILYGEEAFILLLAESDNDIAEAVANSVGTLIDGRAADPRAAFINAMNKKAAALGMGSTHFDNPSGLDSGGQHSNAEDLALLARYVSSKFEDFWDVTRDPPARIRSQSGRYYPVRPSSILKSEGLRGVKTGLSENAKGALLIQYRTPYFPEDLIMVILRSDDRFGDAERLMASVVRAFREMKK